MSAPFPGDYECVALTGLVLPLHIGIRDWERHPDRKQRVRVDVECYRPLGAPPERIDQCVDYSRLYRHVTTAWPARGHTDLLETLAHDLLAFAFADETVTAVRVRLAKLDVYLDDAVPVVELVRRR
ncbi:MAG: dihydroneopterin aldolase [Alphaproteobacteria bacterium]|nr:dihydroneopterin aldolase [Alphaproteobacteria bacterium]MCB9929851.1 dihydroneopterin aldolase [Alphaproteobacteria bacterium]